MSNFSQIMNDRSEARRIYNQRKKISQLELKNEKLEQEIKELKEMWKDTNVIIKDNKKLMMNRNAYDYLEEKDKKIERLNKSLEEQRHFYLKELENKDNIINEFEKYIKENSWYYNTSDGCQWVNQFKVLDKLKELKGNE